MQLLSCDLWLMERSAMRNFAALARSDISVNLEQVRASAPQVSRQKAIGIVPISGVLEARTTMVGELLGMSSYERIGNTFDAMMRDDSVAGIILDVSSPGGMVYGAQELANKIYNARGQKPIVAVANPLMASGAYWIAAAADRVVVTPSGDVGSVGVIAEHVDMSQANAEAGAKVTVIRSSGSPYKAEANDAEPLTDEGLANMQARADAIYSRFVADLAKFRGVSVDHVNEHFGKGRVVDSKTAYSAGMVDRIGTFEEVASKMAAGRVRIASERAQDDWESKTRVELLRERSKAIMASLPANAPESKAV